MKSGENRTHINLTAEGTQKSSWGSVGHETECRQRGVKGGTWWSTPRKHALFGSDGPDSMSSGSDVMEAQLRWPPDDEYPMVAQSGRPYIDDSLEEARSPRMELEDGVVWLQKDLAE